MAHHLTLRASEVQEIPRVHFNELEFLCELDNLSNRILSCSRVDFWLPPLNLLSHGLHR